jgi:hypothetical protein
MLQCLKRGDEPVCTIDWINKLMRHHAELNTGKIRNPHFSSPSTNFAEIIWFTQIEV